MIAHIFAMLPAKSYKIYITSEKKTVATLTMVEMKNSVNEFWKAYVKTMFSTNLYLIGFHLVTIDGWCEDRDQDGWRLKPTKKGARKMVGSVTTSH
jgi:hypothetical protein